MSNFSSGVFVHCWTQDFVPPLLCRRVPQMLSHEQTKCGLQKWRPQMEYRGLLVLVRVLAWTHTHTHFYHFRLSVDGPGRFYKVNHFLISSFQKHCACQPSSPLPAAWSAWNPDLSFSLSLYVALFQPEQIKEAHDFAVPASSSMPPNQLLTSNQVATFQIGCAGRSGPANQFRMNASGDRFSADRMPSRMSSQDGCCKTLSTIHMTWMTKIEEKRKRKNCASHRARNSSCTKTCCHLWDLISSATSMTCDL